MSAYSDAVLADSPVGYWRLNDASGSIVDSSTSSLNGTASGSPTYHTTGGPFSGVDSTNGYLSLVAASSQKVDFGDNNKWSVSNTSLMTWEFWFSFPSFTPVNYGLTKANSGNQYEYQIGSFSLTNIQQEIWTNTAGVDINRAITTGTLSINTWYHFVGTYDNTGGRSGKVYINGSDVSGGTGTTNNGGTYTNGTAPMLLGHRVDDTGTYTTGSFSEIAVYNSILSSSQVAAHYLAATSVSVSVTHVTASTTNYAAVVPSVSAGEGVIVSAPVAGTTNYIGPNDETITHVTASTTNYAALAPSVTAEDIGYSVAVLADNPWLYWKLNEANVSGGAAADAGSNNLPGTYQSDRYPSAIYPTSITGLEATGAHFLRNPDKSYVKSNIGSHYLSNRASDVGSTPVGFSVEIWVKDLSTVTYIIGDPNPPGGSVLTNFCMYYNSFDQKLHFDIPVNDGGGFGYLKRSGAISIGNSLSDGIWHHLVVTVDAGPGLTNNATLYFDGNPVGFQGMSAPHVTPPQIYFMTPVGWRGSGDQLYLGKKGITADNYYLTGSLDEFAVYSYVLDAGQIANHYTIGIKAKSISLSPPVAGTTNYAAVVPEIDAGMITRIDVPVADTTMVQGINPSIATGGNVATPGDTADSIAIRGLAPEVTTTAFIYIEVTANNCAFAGVRPEIQMQIQNFAFIQDNYVGIAAKDAIVDAPLSNLDMGALSHGQERKLRFRLANLDNQASLFHITAASTDTGLPAMVSFSMDNVNFYSTLTIGNVPENTLSEVIWVKFTVSATAFISQGAFLIAVEQDIAA